MNRQWIRSIVRGVMCAFVMTTTAACQEAPRSEKWIGTYSFPNNSPKFPLYLDIKIEGTRVSGRAFDGSMEEATVSGTVDGERYELLLHPLKHGTSAAQDVYYRGRRTKDSIEGSWEHVVGAKGPWTATVTRLAAKEALELHAPPCEPATIAQKPKVGCGKDA